MTRPKLGADFPCVKGLADRQASTTEAAVPLADETETLIGQSSDLLESSRVGGFKLNITIATRLLVLVPSSPPAIPNQHATGGTPWAGSRR